MSWKAVKEVNQTEICTEKCASMHRFLCIRYGMETMTLVQKCLIERRIHLNGKVCQGRID